MLKLPRACRGVRAPARLAFYREDFIEARDYTSKLGCGIKDPAHDVHDLREMDAPGQERGRCLLIGGVVDDPCSLSRGPAGEVDGGKGGIVKRLKTPIMRLRKVQGRLGTWDAVRPIQR